MGRRRRDIAHVMLLTGIVLALIQLWLAFTWVPSVNRESFSDPEAQRIFYWHVPMAWVSFLALSVLFAGSLWWFINHDERGWNLHAASADVALIYVLGVVISGPLWGAAEWGTPWDWGDARLNSYGLLSLIVIFLVLGRRTQPDTQATRDTFSALALFGFLLVPLTIMATWFWQLRHPPALVVGASDEGGSGLGAQSMVWTLLLGVLAFTLLMVSQVMLRLEAVHLEQRLDRVQRALDARAEVSRGAEPT